MTDITVPREVLDWPITQLMQIVDGSNWPEDAQSGPKFEAYTEISEQLNDIILTMQDARRQAALAAPVPAEGEREALATIAKQKTTDELMEENGGEYGGDSEGAYDEIIKIARTALALRTQPPAVDVVTVMEECAFASGYYKGREDAEKAIRARIAARK